MESRNPPAPQIYWYCGATPVHCCCEWPPRVHGNTRGALAHLLLGRSECEISEKTAGKHRQEKAKDSCLSARRVRVDPVVWLPVRSHSLHKSTMTVS